MEEHGSFGSWAELLGADRRRLGPAPPPLGERPEDGYWRKLRLRQKWPQPAPHQLGEWPDAEESWRLLWLPATGELVALRSIAEVLGVVYDEPLLEALLAEVRRDPAVAGLEAAREALGRRVVHTRWTPYPAGAAHRRDRLQRGAVPPLSLGPLLGSPGAVVRIALHDPGRRRGWVITATPAISRVGIAVDRRTPDVVDRWRAIVAGHSAPESVESVVRAAVEGEEPRVLAGARHDRVHIHP